MMKLYHYTCIEHLPVIMRDGVLIPTESNVSLVYTHVGPDVVWLSSDAARPPREGWANGSYYDKTRIRITVDVPDGLKWTDWARVHQVDRLTRQGLILAGGGTHDDWYVVERPIRRDEIIELTDMDTGDVMTLEKEIRK